MSAVKPPLVLLTCIILRNALKEFTRNKMRKVIKKSHIKKTVLRNSSIYSIVSTTAWHQNYFIN